MPKGENGKVDRRKLEEMSSSRSSSRGVGGGNEARGAVEEIVAEIWREVLKRRDVGVEENFFEKGGHSLLATQVVTRVREALKVEMGIRGGLGKRGGVGGEENFFEKGGHSLLATQVVTRVREALKVEMGIREVFEAVTVREQAERIEGRMKEGMERKDERIRRVERGGSLPLSFAQQRLWFLNQMEPDNPFYNCPVS